MRHPRLDLITFVGLHTTFKTKFLFKQISSWIECHTAALQLYQSKLKDK